MRSSFLAAFSLAWLACGAARAASEAPLALRELASGVHVHFGAQEEFGPGNGGDIANLGFVVGERCVAVIDSGGSVEEGRRLRAAVEAATPVPVCYVIDTHMHPDHVLGNAAFIDAVPRPDFVAHVRFAAALAARERFYLHAIERDFGTRLTHEQVIYPTRNVSSTLELDLGGRTLELRAWPTAHTDNDLTVFDTKTKTLFLGDLLFVDRLPVLDGSLRGWLKTLEALRAKDDVALVVPGHGPARSDWPSALEPERTYLTALREQTRTAIRNKMTIQQALAQVATDAAKGWLLAEQTHRRNVTAAYAELEWED